MLSIYTLNSVDYYAESQCGVRSLLRAPTNINGHCWELNPRPFDQGDLLGMTLLPTRPHVYTLVLHSNINHNVNRSGRAYRTVPLHRPTSRHAINELNKKKATMVQG